MIEHPGTINLLLNALDIELNASARSRMLGILLLALNAFPSLPEICTNEKIRLKALMNQVFRQHATKAARVFRYYNLCMSTWDQAPGN